MTSIRVGDVKRICFIGGGRLMAEAMLFARNLGFEVVAIIATRHSTEKINGEENLLEYLSKHTTQVKVTDNPAEASAALVFPNTSNSLALCFGPAWIFPEQVVNSYSRGMFNFNGIPIPRYLGGAHYTWQILNNSFDSGRFIQIITEKVDRGDILMSEISSLDPGLATPADFFQANHGLALKFVQSFLTKLSRGESFESIDFDSVSRDRLYFPRVSTKKNGWIDWSWTGPDIESFCRAFSNPYEGASTKYLGATIRLREAIFHESKKESFHPFCFGLVVRVTHNGFFVSVRGGLLEVLDWKFEEKVWQVLEGERLATPQKLLYEAKTYVPKSSDFI